jgi:hypothetical protein
MGLKYLQKNFANLLKSSETRLTILADLPFKDLYTFKGQLIIEDGSKVGG